VKLVDYPEVRRLVEARDCTVKRVITMTAEVRMLKKPEPVGTFVSADAAGEHWDVIAVMRACDIARSAPGVTYRPPKIEPPKGLDVTAHGLREDLIVEAITANGVWAYRAGQRTLALEALLRCEGAERGLMFADTKQVVRDAARAVADAGLAVLSMGPLGGWSLARITWLPPATIKEMKPEDEAGMGYFGSLGAPK
jgi:hypothetical protein